MCTVNIKVDDALVRRINPGLSSRESINKWLQGQVNAMIFSFYQNVAKKYRHTYDKGDLKRDVQNAVFSIFRIENGLLHREPTISQWAGYHIKIS